MNGKLNEVYIKNTSLVVGPLEAKSNYAKYFDKTYNNYNLDKSFELSEVKLTNDAIDILLKKTKTKKEAIDLFVGGDLTNQICSTSYSFNKYKRPYLGVFSACATSVESLIVASQFIENKIINKAICTTSSHNLVEEKQFRNPIEYGYTKPKTATFTSTGASAIMLTNEKTEVKLTNYTIGKIVDLNQKDPNNVGAAMAPAAADTIYNHLIKNKRKFTDYDLILTGDLGIYGKQILIDYMKKQYKITVENYNDCGAMLYDLEKQTEITAGGSGPVCSTLINYGFVYDMLKKKEFKRVLLVATGALYSSTFILQKQNIISIAHAIELEATLWHIFTHLYFVVSFV